MAIAILLGRVRAPGRVEVIWPMSVYNIEGAQRKERKLTPKAFTHLLAKLDPDPEKAGEKYEKLRRHLIKFFECRGSFISDELADETLNRLARKIDEGEEIEKNVFAFSLGIARFVLLETLKSPDNRRVEMKEMAIVAAAPEPWEEDDDLWIVCLRECMRGVSEENRELIIEYYKGDGRARIDERKMLAARLGISLNTLFARAKRTRDKLEECVTRCAKKKSKGVS
jgi:DNA-directed RNA polymerase specialized sigma24 family protein